MAERITALYRVRSDARSIESRAQAIAVEQSVEMPLSAIHDPDILTGIVGIVREIRDGGGDAFEVEIGLAAATIGDDAGQFLNMLFGNTSLHDAVTLQDVEITPALAIRFGGPRQGIAGLRARVGGTRRALTCSALKPQGLPPDRLADLTEGFARGGIDFVKDDHGLADQGYAPFAERVQACAAAARRASAVTGHPTRYVPSLSGDLDRMRAQIRVARDAGIDTVMVAPMVAGVANLQVLRREAPELAFFAHPTLAGAARIAPQLLLGKLLPLFGADAVIFPSYGGRFGYSPETCRLIAENARHPRAPLRPAMPVPAGGMTLERVPEILDFYGHDAMLLIGGSLLAAGEALTQASSAFTRAVADHTYR